MTTNNKTGNWSNATKAIVAGILSVQFAAAYIIGTGGLLSNDQLSLFAPIAITAFIPVIAFLAAYALSKKVRDFVLNQDIASITMLQHWRIIGFVFIAFYYHGILPGLFAWGAGLGDVAMGLTAPLIMWRLRRDPDYATSTGLVRYQYLGLLDFVVAIVTAGLTSGAYPALIPGGLTSAAMDVWPLNLFPSFIVPGFIILHLVVLLKVRALRKEKAAVDFPICLEM